MARPSKQALTDAQQAAVRDVVKKIRAKMGWSQAKMGTEIGVHQTTIARIEDNGGCTHEVFDKIGRLAKRALDISLQPSAIELPADIYPNRAKAIAAARLLGLNDAAVERIRELQLQPGEQDPAPMAWFQDIRELHLLGREGPRLLPPKKR